MIDPLFLLLPFLGVLPVGYLLVNAYLARKRERSSGRVEVPLREVTLLTPVHYQTMEVFRESIASVAAQGCGFVVVGDGCREPYQSVVESLGGKFVHLEERGGKKRAVAAGLADVRTSYVLLVDSDTVLPPNAARDLASRFVPGVGGVGANLTVKDTGHPVAYCGEFVERAREVVLRAMSSRGSVLYLDGACTLYRTDMIRPFVESAEFQDLRVLGRPSPLGDDWQLTDFLLRRGLTTVKAYDVRAVTYPKETFSAFVQQNVRWSRSNWIRLGRFLTGRGPSNRGTFFTFEVLGTYALPLVALATLLVRVPFLIHTMAEAPPSLTGAALVLLHGLVGLPRTMAAGLARVSLSVVGAFATGVFLGTVVRGSSRSVLRMVAYGALGTAILFATTIYGLVTFWKRPRWGAPHEPIPLGPPAPRPDRTGTGGSTTVVRGSSE